MNHTDDDDNIVALFEPADWTRHAACRGLDPNLFFPERGQDTGPAKAVCATCPVVDDCLDHALRNGIKHGVFGGKSERQRRRMRRQWAAEHGIDLRAEMRPEGACWACRDWISRDREARRTLRRETA